uniref:Mitochondrial splicing suppressor 51-like C-terminal domain-containing protein n=1 Tax=Hyaloperonospora arabidopsidis (strain Emoy2) TaxID=559515 RepID=M4BKS4_HYAAE
MTPADTRAETLIAWLYRLEHAHATTITYPVTKSLTIHILGADYREGNSGAATFEVFRAFTEHVAARTRLTLLQLVLVGPNVSRTLHLEEFTQTCLVPVSDTGEATTCDVRIRYFVGSFEAYFQDKAQVWKPDLVVCFNAGIWGYNEWLPAIQLVLKDVQVPLLVTSYNADEAGDDEDVLDEMKLGEWLWRPEKNPWGATTPRATNNADAKVLKENDYWMCLTGSLHA